MPRQVTQAPIFELDLNNYENKRKTIADGVRSLQNDRLLKKARIQGILGEMKKLHVTENTRQIDFRLQTQQSQVKDEVNEFVSNDQLFKKIPTTKDSNGFTKTFPQRLMDMISYTGSKNIICWNSQGDAFMIIDEDLLSSKLLPLFFKKTKYLSFIRKINRWGFKRYITDKNISAFYHKLFLREKPQLCLHICCQGAKSAISVRKEQSKPHQIQTNNADDRKDEDSISTSDLDGVKMSQNVPYHSFENSQVAIPIFDNVPKPATSPLPVPETSMGINQKKIYFKESQSLAHKVPSLPVLPAMNEQNKLKMESYDAITRQILSNTVLKNSYTRCNPLMIGMKQQNFALVSSTLDAPMNGSNVETTFMSKITQKPDVMPAMRVNQNTAFLRKKNNIAARLA